LQQAFPKLNILMAYPYFSKLKDSEMDWFVKNKDSINFILDSGAFTAWNSGKPIKLDDYISFIKQLPFKPTHTVQLDVIGDADKSYTNYLKMLEKGISCDPVFTRGSSLELLEKLYDTTDFVHIGGVASGKNNKKYVDWLMRRIDGRKCHWLGMANIRYLKKWRPYSVDSSTFSACARFGVMISIYTGVGEIVIITYDEFLKDFSKRKLVLTFRDRWCPELSNADLKNRNSWISWGKTSCLTSVAYILKAIDVEKNLKTKVYIACPDGLQLGFLIRAYETVLARKDGIL